MRIAGEAGGRAVWAGRIAALGVLLFGILLSGIALPGAVLAGEARPQVEQRRTPEEVLETQLEVIRAMLDAGLIESAIQTCADLRASGVDDPRVDLLQARAWHLNGMSAEARTLLERMVKRQPRSAEAWGLLGIVQADQGEVAAARESLERARRLAPGDADLLNNLGYVLLASGDAEAAVAVLREAIQLDPASHRARNNLAFALARLERDSEALELFRSTSGEAGARYNMGAACEARGDRAGAIVHYQAAIRAAPGYVPAVTALARLIHEEGP